MKKRVFAVIAVVLFMSSSINASNLILVDDCGDYAWNSLLAEEEVFGEYNFEDAFEAYLWYYDLCEENNGNVGEPLIIN
ncbi:hypothetical protein [Winogradskyella immobilis]|uniref:Uncharacterized protein n=1 Tax=Winogradskyella immobilis TaxID=2816852 RepID=A0ABS8EQN0_9FLAO|nr:hypothetical protein [Winogradskyella immobilis]MCC1485316.1 hypothetical protein [Winogradskyella immobilis]MCG0017408.1 hypothetical protein [Winogradskyella immobilis]